MNKGTFIIENNQGQTVRSIRFENPTAVLYINLDTRRIELASSSEELDNSGIRYDLLTPVQRDDIKRSALKIGDAGFLRFVDEIDETVPQVVFSNENDKDFKEISKWTLISHGALLLLLFVTSFFIGRTQQISEPVVVKVFEQPPREKTVVKMAEKKIVKQNFKAKVSDHTVKPKHVALTKVAKVKTHVRTQVNVNVTKVGALGALGGMKNGLKGSAGFNVNAANASLGTGLKDIGKGGAGGHERAVHGSGLLTSAVGTGGFAGSGGYATRGKGGGRPGYGNMNMAGGSEGFSLPLDEEALIEGGLDKDQIAAVIQRNLGQVIYCYEKGLQIEPALAGRVAVKFVISGGGLVDTAKVANTSLKSAKVEGCIINKLRGWKFPRPVGNVSVKVTYPFVLRRVG